MSGAGGDGPTKAGGGGGAAGWIDGAAADGGEDGEIGGFPYGGRGGGGASGGGKGGDSDGNSRDGGNATSGGGGGGASTPDPLASGGGNGADLNQTMNSNDYDAVYVEGGHGGGGGGAAWDKGGGGGGDGGGAMGIVSSVGLVVLGDLVVAGGNGGDGGEYFARSSGSYGGATAGDGGDGGGARLNGTGKNITVSGTLSVSSGHDGTDGTIRDEGGSTLVGHPGGGGLGGDVSFTSGTLTAPIINLTKNDGALSFIVGTLDLSADTTITSNVTETGAVVFGSFSGSGTLTLSGGVASLTNDSTVGGLAGNGALTLGAPLTLSAGTGSDYSGALSGTGSLTLSGGLQILSGANNYTGGTIVQAGTGTLAAHHARALGFGPVNNEATLELAFAGDFANALSGSGSVKTAGAVAFTGDHTLHSGTVVVASGSLGLTGASFTSDAAYTVASGATLTGNGTVGSLSVQGTLAPGAVAAPYGALTVNGDLSFAAGSAYAIDLDLGNGAGDALTVHGTVAIDGQAKLTLASVDGTATSGTVRIIDARESQFDDTLFLLDNSWAVSFTQSIAHGGYYLVWERRASYADLAASGRAGANTRSLARALDWATANGIATTGELSAALSGIWTAGDRGESWARLNELSPAVLAGGGISLSVGAANGFRADLGKLREMKWLDDKAWTAATTSATGASSADAWARLATNPADRGWRFWGEVGGAWSEYDSPNGDPGYTAKEWSATVAGYRSFGAAGCDAWSLGAAFNVNHTKLDWEVSPSTTTGDSFAGALMAMYERGPWFASLDGVWGTTDVESRRRLPLAGLSANADYRTHWYGADLAAGYRARLGDWSLTPSAGARWYRYNTPGVTEKGAGTAGLVMERDHRTGVEFFGRLDVSRTWALANGVSLTPRGFVGLSVEAADRWATPAMNFVGAPAGFEPFRGYSPKGGRVSGQAGLGLEAKFRERWMVYGEYTVEFRDREQRHAGQVGLGLAF